MKYLHTMVRVTDLDEPVQGLLHSGPRLAVVAGAGTGMIKSEQRRTKGPLQIGGTRNVERCLEVRRGARVVAEPLGAEAGVADHHQVLGFVALVADAAGQFDRTGVARDRRHRLRVGEVRLAASVPGLHRNEIDASRALADIDRFLVEADRLVVLPGAPCDGPKVIKGVGGMVLVVHCAGLGQRFGEARARLVVLVGSTVGHAQLHQRVARLFAFTTGA